MSDIDNIFTYHVPNNGKIDKYCKIRETAKQFAVLLNEMCPKCQETDIAILKIRESVMWANAAIAIVND